MTTSATTASAEPSVGTGPDEARTQTAAQRPYTVLSCCMSIDGYLDDAGPERLLLSNTADFDRVDAERADSDAILVGAETIRRDNPRLVVRSAGRRAARLAQGRGASPVKVAVTRSGRLDPGAAFFTEGDAERVVYCPSTTVKDVRDRLAGVATVVDAGADGALGAVLADLARRGATRVLVEGGASVVTQVLQSGLADELQLAVAPLFVGDSSAPRLVGEGAFPWTADRRATLASVQQVGDVALLRYALSDRFGPAADGGGA